MIGGKCFGVFCYVPRDLSNGTWIIAIGHHSRKLARQVCLFVFPFFLPFFCHANCPNFAEGYRPEFSSDQAANFYQQSPRANWIPFLEIGGLGPPKGIFCPLKTPQRTKKVAVNNAKLC